jgi:hypothetical protein
MTDMSNFLPPGLDPIAAAALACGCSEKDPTVEPYAAPFPHRALLALVSRTASLIWSRPGPYNEYPGRERILPHFCGVARETARDWLYRQDHIPPHHARRLAAIARTRAAQFEALAKDLEQHATTREAHNRKPCGIIKQREFGDV